MLGFLFIFFSSVAFGFSNAYWKKAIQGYSFLKIIFVRGLFTTLFFGICVGLDWNYGLFQNWLGHTPDFTVQHWVLSAGLCFFSAFGLYFFVQSLQSKAVTLVAPISSINLFGLLTTVFVLGESWGIQSSLALVFVFLGLYFLFQKEFQFHGMRALGSAISGGLLSSFFWGVSYTLFKFPVAWLGVLPFTLLLEGSVTLLVGVFLLFQKQVWQKIPLGPVLVLALCVILGSTFLHLAYSKASMTQIIFVGKSQLVLTLFFGRILYHEKWSINQGIGIALLILSIYIIA
jgi:drug/metabolite transporter (DMT)-like permease